MYTKHALIKTLLTLKQQIFTKLANRASVIRIGVWTLIFSISIITIATTINPVTNLAMELKYRDFFQVTDDSYTELPKSAYQSSQTRIAIIGSSESIDFKHSVSPRYSLGISMFKNAPHYIDTPIEVIEYARPGLRTFMKQSLIHQALERGADIVVVAIPARQLDQQEYAWIMYPKISSWHEFIYEVLTVIQTPIGFIHNIINEHYLNYRLSINRCMTLRKAPKVTEQDSTLTVDHEGPVGNNHLNNTSTNSVLTVEDLSDYFRMLAMPIADKSQTLIILLTPYNSQNGTQENAQYQELGKRVDMATQNLVYPNVFVLNTINSKSFKTEDFKDAVHMVDFSVLSALVFETIKSLPSPDSTPLEKPQGNE